MFKTFFSSFKIIYLFICLLIYLFIWLRWVLVPVPAHRIFVVGVGSSLQHLGSLVVACKLLVAACVWDLVP